MSAHQVVRPLNGLWLVREFPYPQDCGERIYSANLIESVARSGADLTVVGLKEGSDPPSGGDALQWQLVEGSPRSLVRSLASTLPLVTARYATRSYRESLQWLATSRWDFVVLDHYATTWVLPLLDQLLGDGCVKIHISHNVESTVAGGMARQFSGGLLKNLALWLNHLKIRALEHRIVSAVDLLCAITEEDAAAYRATVSDLPILTLTPGYRGEVSDRVRIDHATPRRVLMIGSYHWVAKQENLRQFLRVADPILHAAGVELHVIGSLPTALMEELQSKTKAVKFLGFVDDLATHLCNARIAVVPELIGGGFKLKSLTYVFGRMPMVVLKEAATGLPPEVRAHQLELDHLEELAPAIVSLIDNLDMLNAMQQKALDAASDLFDWDLRGMTLLKEIQRIQTLRSAARQAPALRHGVADRAAFRQES